MARTGLRAGAWATCLSVACAAAALSCDAILGIDDRTPIEQTGPSGTGTGGGASTSASVTGSGGTTGSSSSGSGGSGGGAQCVDNDDCAGSPEGPVCDQGTCV